MDDVKTFPRISKVHLDPKDGQATLTVGVVKKKLTAHVQSEASEMGAGQEHREIGSLSSNESRVFCPRTNQSKGHVC